MSRRKDVEIAVDCGHHDRSYVSAAEYAWGLGYLAGLRAALRAIRDDAYAADAREAIRAMIARRRKG